MNQQDMSHPTEQIELTDSELALVEGGGLFSKIKHAIATVLNPILSAFSNGVVELDW